MYAFIVFSNDVWICTICIHAYFKMSCLLMHGQKHDDVIKRKYFPRFGPCVRGIHWSQVNSPHKGQWRGDLMFSLICAWINGWVNNGKTGDFRRHHAHYGVTGMDEIHYGLHALNLVQRGFQFLQRSHFLIFLFQSFPRALYIWMNMTLSWIPFSIYLYIYKYIYICIRIINQWRRCASLETSHGVLCDRVKWWC